MRFKVVQHPSKVLRQDTEDVDLDKPLSYYNRLTWELKSSMKQFNGVGMACPQIAKNLRACYVRSPLFEGLVMNPELVQTTGPKERGEEGCLSIPGRWFDVPRFPMVDVKFFTIEDEEVTEKQLIVTGFSARVFQHEMDHLDGMCIPDRLKNPF